MVSRTMRYFILFTILILCGRNVLYLFNNIYYFVVIKATYVVFRNLGN